MRLTRTHEGNTELSLYTGGLLTDKILATNIKKLSEAFPRQSEEFWDILTERIIANGFTDERLTDAVNFLIDNFRYRELSIADLIAYDKTVRLYTYKEVANLVTTHQARFEDFETRNINGITYRIKKTDLNR